MRFVRHGRGVGTDEIHEFEQALVRSKEISMLDEKSPSEHELIEEASFEDLLNLAKGDLDEAETAVKKGKKLEETHKSKNAEHVAEELRRKERKLVGLDRQVNRAGFIVFKDRLSKL